MAAELNRRQAAEALGLSATTFSARAKDPSCPLGEGVKRGRTTYWSTEAIEAMRVWEAARRASKSAPEAGSEKPAGKAANSNVSAPSHSPESAKPAKKTDDAAARFSVAVDPVTLWLDACRSAATIFQTSADPRRALFLMNPFAPYAAYAAFTQPSFIESLVKQAGSGLGVWGALPYGLGAGSSAAKGVSESAPARCAAERAQLERSKLYRCAAARRG